MRVIHGPRPKSKIRPDQLPELEASGHWCAQRKFNGSKTTFKVHEGKVQFFNKGKPFKRWKPPVSLIEQFSVLNLPQDQVFWFDGELLEPRVKNTVVIYDILQADRYLIGMKQWDRLQKLDEICGKPRSRCELEIALQVTDNIWMAEFWERSFVEHYEEFLHLDLIEGLVLRKKDAKLDNRGHMAYDTDAQVRCRKNASNYRF